MANIRQTHTPAPLDISHLDLGEPLADETAAPASTALVKRHQLGFPNTRDITPEGPKPDHNPDNDRIIIRRSGVPNVRYMTPRQMQAYSESLYAAGVIDFEDYEAMAFQCDLHPQFNVTIGALTGQKANPDRPRDYIIYWMERLTFAKRYSAADAIDVRRADRILSALKTYPQEADALAVPSKHSTCA